VPKSLSILLDQNIPPPTTLWLQKLKSGWKVCHVKEVGLEGKSDDDIFDWAQKEQMVIITYDEDFADKRLFSTRNHAGIIRLRVWPTTVEETQNALERLFATVSDEEIQGSLVIIGRSHIRVRGRNPTKE